MNDPRTADTPTADPDERKQTIYRMFAYYAPASPMGLLPACWKVMHDCTTCHDPGRSRPAHRGRSSARQGGGRHRRPDSPQARRPAQQLGNFGDRVWE